MGIVRKGFAQPAYIAALVLSGVAWCLARLGQSFFELGCHIEGVKVIHLTEEEFEEIQRQAEEKDDS